MPDRPSVSRSSTLGNALRSLRQERGLSLAAASKLTGFSVATLSKVENGKRTLAYDKLLHLANVLDVDITRLFSAEKVPASHSLAAGRRSVQRSGEGFVIEAGVYTYTYLAQDLVQKRFSPVVMELHARGIGEFEQLLSHGGEEHVFVLEGEVIVHTDIYEPLRLGVGDSVYLDSGSGHAYLNGGEGPARILCVASTAVPLTHGGDYPVAQRANVVEPAIAKAADGRPLARRKNIGARRKKDDPGTAQHPAP